MVSLELRNPYADLAAKCEPLAVEHTTDNLGLRAREGANRMGDEAEPKKAPGSPSTNSKELGGAEQGTASTDPAHERDEPAHEQDESAPRAPRPFQSAAAARTEKKTQQAQKRSNLAQKHSMDAQRNSEAAQEHSREAQKKVSRPPKK